MNIAVARAWFFCAATVVATSACIPEHLKKYQKESDAKSSAAAPVPPTTDVSPPSSVSEKREAAKDDAPRASIYAVDKQTFRFLVGDAEVWESALSVLMRNYNLTIVDKASGVITTEWDSYYLNSAVYRNKVSLRVAKTGRGQVEVTVHNNVERLKDASQAAQGTVGAVWLPAEDLANEVARIVQNMALTLNQPPPVLPPNMSSVGPSVARDSLAEPSNIKR
jgi:hypothetical protein